MIQGFQLPTPPPESQPTFQGWLQWISQYGNTLYTYFNTWEGALSKQFNTLFNDYGADLVAAANMTVSAAVHQVTGSTKVTTLSQPPGQTAVSVVTLFAKDGFTLGAGQNIGVPISVPAGTAVTLAYHPALKKWLSIGNPQVLTVSTSANSPYTVQGGSELFVTADTAIFIANLPTSPEIGDEVFVKTLNGSAFATALTPGGGVVIDNQVAGAALNVSVGSTARLRWIGTSWQSIYKST